MRAYRVTLLSFVLSLLFIFSAQASEQIYEIGKIFYSKEISAYYFVYIKDDKIVSHILDSKNIKNNKLFKSNEGKSVRLRGALTLKRKQGDSFFLREELNISQLEEFELSVLAFDSRKYFEHEKYVSHEQSIRQPQTSKGISLSDETTNSFLSAAAVALGIATGPISLIPASVFGIYQALQ